MKIYIELSYENIIELDTNKISAKSILYLITEAKKFKSNGWSHNKDTTYKQVDNNWAILNINESQFEEPPEVNINSILEENNRLQREIDLLKASQPITNESKEILI